MFQIWFKIKIDMEAERLYFDQDFDFSNSNPRYCYLDDDRIEFIDFERYVGPVTLQYLPNGGIQSLFHGDLIIKVNNGFLKVTKVIFNKQELTSKEFINLIGEENLANQVLL